MRSIYKSASVTINQAGEIIEKSEYNVTKLPQEPPYIKLYTDEISRIYDLGRVQHMVLFELVSRSGFTGEVAIGPRIKSGIAERYKTTIQTIDNTILALIKKGLIQRIGRGEFLLDPNLFGKGSWKDILERRATYKELKKTTITLKIEYDHEKGERKIHGKVIRGESA